jgi:hypothetical protein
MPWMPEVFTTPIPETRRIEARREEDTARTNDAIAYYEGILAGEPDALVRSFAGHSPESTTRASGKDALRALRQSNVRFAEHDLLVILRAVHRVNRKPDYSKHFANLEWIVILRLCTSIEPSRWNSLMTFETASRVEAIMFASSWFVRRTPRIVLGPSSSLKRSARFKSRVARRVETSRCRRLSTTSSDCLRRSEKEEKSFMANSGRRFMTSVKVVF